MLLQQLGTWLQCFQWKSKGSPQPLSHIGRDREAQGQEKDLPPLHRPASKRAQGQPGQFCALAHTPSSVNQPQLVDTGKAEVISAISWLQSCHLASCLCAGVPCDLHGSHQNRSPSYTHPALLRKRKNNNKPSLYLEIKLTSIYFHKTQFGWLCICWASLFLEPLCSGDCVCWIWGTVVKVLWTDWEENPEYVGLVFLSVWCVLLWNLFPFLLILMCLDKPSPVPIPWGVFVINAGIICQWQPWPRWCQSWLSEVSSETGATCLHCSLDVGAWQIPARDGWLWIPTEILAQCYLENPAASVHVWKSCSLKPPPGFGSRAKSFHRVCRDVLHRC